VSVGNPSELAPVTESAVDAENPWPGLASFHELDHPFFHGRDDEIAELHRLIMRERATLLFGLAGLGKTSLLHAGLFPRLREHTFLPVPIRLDHADDVALRAQVKLALRRQALAHAVEAPREIDAETVWEHFHRADADYWNARNRLVVPVLVFDQFEEIFTHGRATAARAAASREFLEELIDLIEGRPPAALKTVLDARPEEARRFAFNRHNYKVAIAIREDFLPEFEEVQRRIAVLAHNRLRLRRMDGHQALAVVTRSGARLVDEAAVERIVRFAAGDLEERPLAELEIEPALLSVFCRELNNRRRRLGHPRITPDLLEGHRSEILTEFYERSVADQAPEVRSFVEDKLLTPTGFRESLALDSALSLPGVTRPVIETLVARRLLHLEERGRVPRIELTHDVLTGVVRESRDRRRQREAHEATERARQRAEQEAERARRELHAARRRAVILAGLALLALAGAVWGVVGQWRANQERVKAVEQRRSAQAAEAHAQEARRQADEARVQAEADRAQADADRARAESAERERGVEAQKAFTLRDEAERLRRVARSRELVARSLFEGTRDPVPALVLGIEALRVADTSEARDALQRALQAQHVVTILPHDTTVDAAAFGTADGSVVVATGDRDGRIRIWSLTGQLLRTLGGASRPAGAGTKDDAVTSLAFSPDGSRLVSADGRALRVWDTRTWTALPTTPPKRGTVVRITFSPDGRRVVTADYPPRVWDLESGKQIVEAATYHRVGYSTALSPDGRYLAVSTGDAYGAHLWDLEAPSSRPVSLRVRGEVQQVSFSGDGQWVAALGRSQAYVWSVQRPDSERQPVSLPHPAAVTHVAFNPAVPAELVTLGADGDVRFWRPSGGPAPEWKQTLSLRAHQGPARHAEFSRDGLKLATTGDDGTTRLWERVPPPPPPLVADRWIASSTLRGHLDYVRPWVVFAPDGRHLLAFADRRVRIMETGPDREVAVFRRPGWQIEHVEFDPQLSRAVTAYHRLDRPGEKPVGVWNTATGERTQILQPAEAVRGATAHATVSPDGRYIVTTHGDPALRLWSSEGGPAPVVLHHDARGAAFRSVVFGPDGLRIAATDTSQHIRIFTVVAEKGRPTALRSSPVIAWAGQPWPRVAFSPDGSRLVARDVGGETRIWDSRSLQLLQFFSASLVAFSDGGRSVVVATGQPAPPLGVRWLSPGRVVLREIDTGVVVDEITARRPGAVNKLFVKDGGHVAFVYRDESVEIAHARRPDRRTVLKARRPGVFDVEFSADGRLVALLGSDRVVRVYTTSDGKLLRALPEQSVDRAGFSRDGRRAWTLSFESRHSRDADAVRVFALERDDLLAVGESRLPKSLRTTDRDAILREPGTPTTESQRAPAPPPGPVRP
jgi:WD40 repeat protein